MLKGCVRTVRLVSSITVWQPFIVCILDNDWPCSTYSTHDHLHKTKSAYDEIDDEGIAPLLYTLNRR